MAYGDIVAVDTYTPNDGEIFAKSDPSICHVAGAVYAIATYSSFLDPPHGYELRTLQISSAGIITKSFIDLKSLGGSQNNNLSVTITKISPGVFAILWGDNFTETWQITTIAIADDGTIGSIIATATGNVYDRSATGSCKLLNVSGNIWAFIMYEELDGSPTYNRGLVIRTITITPAGAIGSVASTLTITTNTGGSGYSVAGFNFYHIKGSVYGVAYVGGATPAADTTIKTFTISNLGVISAVSDTLVVDTVGTYKGDPVLFHISGTIWAVAYNSNDDLSKVSTVSIDDGNIGSIIATFTFDTGIPTQGYEGGFNPVVQADANKWTIFWRTNDYMLYGATLNISSDGITIAFYANPAQFISGESRPGNILYIGTDYYVICVDTSSGADGLQIKTMSISTNPRSDNPLVRVAGIRHIYRQGSYREELYFGDVSVSRKLPEYTPVVSKPSDIDVVPGPVYPTAPTFFDFPDLPQDTANDWWKVWVPILGYSTMIEAAKAVEFEAAQQQKTLSPWQTLINNIKKWFGG